MNANTLLGTRILGKQEREVWHGKGGANTRGRLARTRHP